MNKLTNDSCLLRAFLLLYCLLLSWDVNAQIWIGPDKLKIPIPQEAKPYTRWWWLGSAVDSVGLDYNLKEFAKVGIGGVEITPIYGVQGNDANDIPYLSPRWMRMLKYVEDRGKELGIETDMAMFLPPRNSPSASTCMGVMNFLFLSGRSNTCNSSLLTGGSG